jgi:hypothetical protein
MLPHMKNWPFKVLNSDINKERKSSLKMIWKMDRNMLERFKCFNATILD